MGGGKSSDGKAKGGKDSKDGGKGGPKGPKGKDGGKGKASGKGEDGGKGKGGGKDGGKGKGKGKDGGKAGRVFDEPAAPAALGADDEVVIAKRDGGRQRGGDRQPLEFKGDHCEVKKHSEMGCAVVTMESQTARDAVLRLTTDRTPDPKDGTEKRPEVTIADTRIQLRAHVDKSEKTDTKTDLFIAWGRKAEKASPIPSETISQAFDDLFREAQRMLGQDTAAATASLRSMLAAMPQTNAPARPLPGAPVAAPAAPFLGFSPAAAAAQPTAAAAHAAAQQQYAAMMARQMMMQQAAMQQVAMQQAAMQQAAMQQAAMQQAAMQQAAAAQLTQQQAATQKEMRADAPEFNFAPASQESPAQAPPKVWTITNPNTNKAIDVPHAHQGFSPPKKADSKVMAIVDPNSGDKISAVDFAPPKDTASFTITDPQSGTAVKV